jgi:predicted DNA-binding transcriptional regulator AlpA
MQQQDTGIDKLSPLMTLEEVCCFFGGSAPLHPATIYRGIGVRYPQPVKIGPNSNRWLRTECEAALRVLADERRSAPTFVTKRSILPTDVAAKSSTPGPENPTRTKKRRRLCGLDQLRRRAIPVRAILRQRP